MNLLSEALVDNYVIRSILLDEYNKDLYRLIKRNNDADREKRFRNTKLAAYF